MDTAPNTAEPGAQRTCRCGHTRSHPMVQPDPKYSLWGWLLLGLGATPRPIRVEYRCVRCQALFGATTDPAVLKKIS